jgi:hypothetical protein
MPRPKYLVSAMVERKSDRARGRVVGLKRVAADLPDAMYVKVSYLFEIELLGTSEKMSGDGQWLIQNFRWIA